MYRSLKLWRYLLSAGLCHRSSSSGNKHAVMTASNIDASRLGLRLTPGLTTNALYVTETAPNSSAYSVDVEVTRVVDSFKSTSTKNDGFDLIFLIFTVWHARFSFSCSSYSTILQAFSNIFSTVVEICCRISTTYTRDHTLTFACRSRRIVIVHESTRRRLTNNNINPLECKDNYSATSNNMESLHWLLLGGLLHLVQREEDCARPQPAEAPPRCTKCNSPLINGQCTNYRI